MGARGGGSTEDGGGSGDKLRAELFGVAEGALSEVEACQELTCSLAALCNTLFHSIHSSIPSLSLQLLIPCPANLTFVFFSPSRSCLPVPTSCYLLSFTRAFRYSSILHSHLLLSLSIAYPPTLSLLSSLSGLSAVWPRTSFLN